jgi:DNA polymerase III epsilon subunit-like protein
LKKYNKPVLVIQNAEFDMRYLNTRNPIVKFNNEVLDTKQIIQLFYLPLLQKLSESEEWAHEMVTKIGTSDRDSGLISSSMSKIGPALKIDMNGYHDALTDCRITTEMLQKIISFLKKYQDLDITKYQAERIKTKR